MAELDLEDERNKSVLARLVSEGGGVIDGVVYSAGLPSDYQ